MLRVEYYTHLILNKPNLQNMSSGKLIMLNFKQFLGWLYYIYCVGTPCSYSILPICRGKRKSSSGSFKWGAKLLPSRRYVCLCHRKDNNLNYQQKFSIQLFLRKACIYNGIELKKSSHYVNLLYRRFYWNGTILLCQRTPVFGEL